MDFLSLSLVSGWLWSDTERKQKDFNSEINELEIEYIDVSSLISVERRD